MWMIERFRRWQEYRARKAMRPWDGVPRLCDFLNGIVEQTPPAIPGSKQDLLLLLDDPDVRRKIAGVIGALAAAGFPPLDGVPRISDFLVRPEDMDHVVTRRFPADEVPFASLRSDSVPARGSARSDDQDSPLPCAETGELKTKG